LGALALLAAARPASAQVTTTYSYDRQAQVTAVIRPANTVTYGYDAAGNRVALSVSYPAPGAAAGSLSVPFGGSANLALAVSGQVTGAAVDAAPTKGSVTISGTTATYTASGSNYGADSFTYHAVGPGGNSPVRTISVTIANPPAPSAGAVSASIAYNTAKAITLAPSGVYTSLAVAAGPSHGSASISGATATYTPTSGYSGADAFTYTATGPGGTSSAATVSVTVANAAAPTVAAVSASTAYNTAKAIALSPSGVYSSLAVASGPSHGTASISGTTATYTPTSGYYGSDSFTYTATGSGGTSAAATVSITVGNPPAPTVAAVSASTAYNTAKAIALSPSGVYNALAVAAGPSHGSASISGTTATYTPTSGYYGSDSFTYTATGPGGTSAAATVTVTVANPPAPTVSAVSATTAYNTAKAIGLSPSGVYNALAVAAGPAHGSASISGATATYTPTSGYYGSDSFTYTATGPGGTSSAATVSITVSTPAPPTVSAVSASTAYNTASNIGLSPSGVYNALAVAAGPAHGSASISGTTATYTPTSGYYGADSFTYTATGPGGISSAATVSITVSVPAPPTVSAVSASTAYNTAANIGLSPSGIYSSLAVAAGPSHGTASISGTTATYTPTSGYYGFDSFTYTATGPGGTSSAATVSVTVVTPPAPGVSDASLSLNYGSNGVLNLPVTGVYSSIAFPSAPTQGSLSLSGSTVTYIPYSGRVGADSFTYTATGPGGTSAAATVSVNIVPPAPPTAGAVSANVAYNTATDVQLAITGVEYTTSIYSNPSHGTVANHGSYVTYLPTTGYSGPDSFSYIVHNPGGYSDVATVSVTVANPPAAPQPTPQPDTAEVHSRGTVVISPLANDTDPSGYPLTITAVSSNGGGTPSIINGSTQINYLAPTVATRSNKIVTLTYTVSNGHGSVASSTVTVTVDTEYYD